MRGRKPETRRCQNISGHCLNYQAPISARVQRQTRWESSDRVDSEESVVVESIKNVVAVRLEGEMTGFRVI